MPVLLLVALVVVIALWIGALIVALVLGGPVIRRIAGVLLIVSCLGGATLAQFQAMNVHKNLAMMAPTGPEPDQPEIVLLTHVLGGFRGFIVDAVWLRAGELQQDGKFWELYQLYNWMGKLEPHIEEIWDHIGWNMSYNLVSELQDSEARWQWIARAISYLRDEGLKYNPRSGKIMERIGWIFFHKIGRDVDMHHYYYKHRWALIMHPIFLNREEQDVQGIMDAPLSLTEPTTVMLPDGSTKETPGLLHDPDVARALSPRFKLDPPEETIRQIDAVNGNAVKSYPEPLQAVLSDPSNAAALHKIRCYTAARILRTQYKMDRPDIMVEMEKRYGKFDWRLPEPHAIYWSLLAQATEPNPKRMISYERVEWYSVQETWRRGQIALLTANPNDPLVTASDLSKIAPMNEIYKAKLASFPKGVLRNVTPDLDAVRDAHVSFLQEAEVDLYFAGYISEAQKYHEELYKLYDKPDPYEDLKTTVLGKVQKGIDENWTPAKTRAFVDSLIVRSCFFECLNKPVEARKFKYEAWRAWDAFSIYTEAQRKSNANRIRANEKALPTFEEIYNGDVALILQGRMEGFPAPLIPVLRKISGIPADAHLDNLKVEDIITPPIPPSSPPPK